ncbi:hypothetical protein GPK34_00245 [Secundilactobacillus kimchicus]|uniref:hypothetical protein n=1 Tax=Secundilactobacillus kimchicus TaxID=528209 RepID=UPI001C034A86|nr:hypothetical protein [Secundilactobacillus kimchicus]MBT9670466.1 hypothetical protein [Secundilactobacillus kimchicus]
MNNRHRRVERLQMKYLSYLLSRFNATQYRLDNDPSSYQNQFERTLEESINQHTLQEAVNVSVHINRLKAQRKRRGKMRGLAELTFTYPSK